MATLIDSLTSYTLLGTSGLRVSPLCLGTMTFGTEWGWGAPKETSLAILDRYAECGGNFIDTADGYTNGSSETFIGEWMKEKQNRDRMVVATKYSFGQKRGNPNAGGNGRKNLYRALEGSLARLQTDFVDLYWVHAWDGYTPVEEVMSTLDDLVRAGKVRAIGLSNTPAWYLARAQTLAEWRGFEKVCALQLEYSLVERNIEREHVPAALELGMSITPWSPLASGLLSGKYTDTRGALTGEGRLQQTKVSTNPAFQKVFTERNFRIAGLLSEVAATLGKTPAQVALNWVTRRPGVSSTIVGATSLAQLDQNLMSLEFTIPAEAQRKLDEATRIESLNPSLFWEPTISAAINSAPRVAAKPPGFWGA